MKVYCIGDIHGNYKGLIQAIERSPFKPEEDLLISLGDLVDGGSESYEVIEYLSSLPNCILIRGNHDKWFTDWLETTIHPAEWGQGASKTAVSYINNLDMPYRSIFDEDFSYNQILEDMYKYFPVKHKVFLMSAINYYIDSKNRIFVHGGFDRFESIENQEEEEFYWNRNLWSQALSAGNTRLKTVEPFSKIFIGHTTTMFQKGKTNPIQAGGVWNLDTGAGSSGKVTIMDVDTEEYWQSDMVAELYGKPFYR